MKPISRSERGKRVVRSASVGRVIRDIVRSGNPLKGNYDKTAYAQVSMKGAGLFVGFSVKF